MSLPARMPLTVKYSNLRIVLVNQRELMVARTVQHTSNSLLPTTSKPAMVVDRSAAQA